MPEDNGLGPGAVLILRADVIADLLRVLGGSEERIAEYEALGGQLMMLQDGVATPLED